MGTVIRFPRHKWFRCNPSTCNGCMFCHGGLGACRTCGGFEGSLPTDCPQYRCTAETLDKIYAGRVDYRRREGWTITGG